MEKALGCLENPNQVRHLVSQCVVARPCRRNGVQHRWCEVFSKDVGRAPLGRRKELVALAQAVPFEPFVSAETLKASALVGLHYLAADGEAGSSGCQSPEETCGDTVARKALTGTATLSHGLKAEALLHRGSANQRGKPSSECFRSKLARRKGVPLPAVFTLFEQEVSLLQVTQRMFADSISLHIYIYMLFFYD